VLCLRHFRAEKILDKPHLPSGSIRLNREEASPMIDTDQPDMRYCNYNNIFIGFGGQFGLGKMES
jgi:hypothetical protein